MASGSKAGNESLVEEKVAIEIAYPTLSMLLPTYDGNRKTLSFYIEGVENALDLIANKTDPSIACLIRNKLTGKAVEALSQSGGAKTWPEIKATLIKRFGEFRTEIQLVQELMTSTRDNLSLEAFGDKIRHLASTLILIDPNKREYYEQMALIAFLEKLNPITAIIIKLKNIENLEEAIIIAKQEEFKLRAKKSLNKEMIKPSTSNVIPQRFNQNKRELLNKNKPSYTENPKRKMVHYQNEAITDEELADILELNEDCDDEDTQQENFQIDSENENIK
ncbi:uncharacterized protein LOC114242253 [Bombyx mandarina]|uniref:Uncharacterized protein LOC114242253 n=1 Tax=Bombyx mandarina TaxID=7092 RepID=A0A6J2JIQ4_BOMMA|nr:uncharacterized protein LOC114242253 [Bombyx mandarina]